MCYLRGSLQEYLRYRQYRFERLDGSVTGSERQNAIDRFCEPGTPPVRFLSWISRTYLRESERRLLRRMFVSPSPDTNETFRVSPQLPNFRVRSPESSHVRWITIAVCVVWRGSDEIWRRTVCGYNRELFAWTVALFPGCSIFSERYIDAFCYSGVIARWIGCSVRWPDLQYLLHPLPPPAPHILDLVLLSTLQPQFLVFVLRVQV